MPTGLKPGIAAPPMQPLGAPSFTVPYPSAVGAAGPTIDLGTLMQAGTQQYQGPDVGPYSDAWLEILNYSDSVLSPQFDVGGITHPPIPAGYAWSAPIPVTARFCTTTIAMQTTVQFFPNELLFATFYTAADIRHGFRPRAGPLVPSLPAAAIGPGALPAGVTIGASQVQPGTYPTGDFTLRGILHWLTTLNAADQLEDWQQGYGLFSDNVGVFAGSTSRLWIASDGSAQISEVHVGPRTGNTLNWVRIRTANLRIDGTGATTPGSFQVQGGVKTSLDAGTITTDGSGNLTANSIASLGGQATVGSGVPLKIAQATVNGITATTLQTIITYAVTVTGFYRVNAYVRVNNGVSGQKIILRVSYTDPDTGGGVNAAFITPVTVLASGGVDVPTVVDQNTSNPNGAIPSTPLVIHAQTGTNILCQYQDPLNTPNDSVTFIIERLS